MYRNVFSLELFVLQLVHYQNPCLYHVSIANYINYSIRVVLHF